MVSSSLIPRVVAAPALGPRVDVKVGVTSVVLPAVVPKDDVNGPLTVIVGAVTKPTPAFVMPGLTPAPSSLRTIVLPIVMLAAVLGMLSWVAATASAVSPGLTVVAALAGSTR